MSAARRKAGCGTSSGCNETASVWRNMTAVDFKIFEFSYSGRSWVSERASGRVRQLLDRGSDLDGLTTPA